MRRQIRGRKVTTTEKQVLDWLFISNIDFRSYLCIAQVLHLLCDLRCVGCETVLIVCQHHILNEELTHCL